MDEYNSDKTIESLNDRVLVLCTTIANKNDYIKDLQKSNDKLKQEIIKLNFKIKHTKNS